MPQDTILDLVLQVLHVYSCLNYIVHVCEHTDSITSSDYYSDMFNTERTQSTLQVRAILNSGC